MPNEPQSTIKNSQLPIDPRVYHELPLKEQLVHIQKARGKAKYQLIINSRKPELVVPRLHPQELYLTINELGAVDALDLIALASPEQITLALDLDCWHRDRLEADTSLDWLEFLLNCGEEKICQIARSVEPEILALILKKHLTITRGIEAYDDDDAENARRLESLYDIDYRSEDAAKIIGAIIKIWQELEQSCFLQIMETVRNEQLSVLEEEVFQNRNARLLDYGLIPENEARSIYALVDPQQFTTGDKADFAVEAQALPSPLAILNCATPANLFAAVLEAGVRHETACELLHLVNRRFSADGIDLSSEKDIADNLQATYDILNLALEYLAGSDSGTATQIMDSTYIQRLFQLGHTLVKHCQLRAEKVAQHQAAEELDDSATLFLDSLIQQPPLHYLPGGEGVPATIRPITSLQQLRLVEEQLTALESALTG